MQKSYLAAVITLTCVLGLGLSARAQDTEGVRVKVPFEFVAGGVTLPAGTYTVGRRSLDTYAGIAISGNGYGTLVLPTTVGVVRAEQPKLNFAHVADKYFLTEADTPGGIYTFALSRAMVATAPAKDQVTVSSAGTN